MVKIHQDEDAIIPCLVTNSGLDKIFPDGNSFFIFLPCSSFRHHPMLHAIDMNSCYCAIAIVHAIAHAKLCLLLVLFMLNFDLSVFIFIAIILFLLVLLMLIAKICFYYYHSCYYSPLVFVLIPLLLLVLSDCSLIGVVWLHFIGIVSITMILVFMHLGLVLDNNFIYGYGWLLLGHYHSFTAVVTTIHSLHF